jgi:hypothetical protein
MWLTVDHYSTLGVEETISSITDVARIAESIADRILYLSFAKVSPSSELTTQNPTRDSRTQPT